MNENKSTITIDVSDEDINDEYDERIADSSRCMLAEAFKRRLDLRPGIDTVDIGYRSWTVAGPGGEINGRFNPQTGKKIKDWDEGTRHDPFTINVTFPADWRQKINGEK